MTKGEGQPTAKTTDYCLLCPLTIAYLIKCSDVQGIYTLELPVEVSKNSQISMNTLTIKSIENQQNHVGLLKFAREHCSSHVGLLKRAPEHCSSLLVFHPFALQQFMGNKSFLY